VANIPHPKGRIGEHVPKNADPHRGRELPFRVTLISDYRKTGHSGKLVYGKLIKGEKAQKQSFDP
jgi:hypothetical protein